MLDEKDEDMDSIGMKLFADMDSRYWTITQNNFFPLFQEEVFLREYEARRKPL